MVVVALLGVAWASSRSTGTERDLSGQAAAWFVSLDEDQRESLLFAFDDEERFDVRVAPLWLEGLRRDHMTPVQWNAFRDVLGTTLSNEGLTKVEAVISLESEVKRLDEESWLMSVLGRFIHGQERYYVAFFGEPSTGTPWGVRLEGHHVSLNWTAAPGMPVATTPFFLGSQPREVPAGWARGGLRVLGAEEDAGYALWRSLDATQRNQAELTFEYATGIGYRTRPMFVGEGSEVELGEPVGFPRSQMNLIQQGLFDQLLEVYFSRLRASARAPVELTAGDEAYFAWAGDLEPGNPGYYRVQGGPLIIEFDNTVPDADHVHTMIRRTDDDFGRNMLREHYESHRHD